MAVRLTTWTIIRLAYVGQDMQLWLAEAFLTENISFIYCLPTVFSNSLLGMHLNSINCSQNFDWMNGDVHFSIFWKSS